MFQGYAGYGGVELINVARLVKYAAEGAAPADVRVTPMVGDYSDLPAALGHDVYRTPLLDAAPWYDETNPDSALFAGLMPLDLGGLMGSTKKRTVTEKITAGGSPTAVRAGSKVIPVTVLALAAGEAALDAGLTWLAGVLHPACSSVSTSCSGSPLDLFSAAPVYCDQLPDLSATPLVSDLLTGEVEADGPTLTYVDVAGTYLPPICAEVTVSATVRIGDTDTLPSTDGRFVELRLVDTTGTVYAASVPVAIPEDGSPVTLTVAVDPSPGFPMDWQPVLYWYGTVLPGGGDVIYSGGSASAAGPNIISGGDATGSAPDLLSGGDVDGPWEQSPAGAASPDAYGGALHVEAWTLTRLPFLTADDCLTDLRRSFRNVVTIDGPTVVETLLDEDGEPYAARVEWTWVATDPTAYGDTIELLRGLSIGAPGPVSDMTVDAASIGPLSLTAPPAPAIPPYRLDGVAISVGSRVLFKDQPDAAENGIRVFQGYSLPWVRATDMDAWGETVGADVYVSSGFTNGGTLWHSGTTGGGTLDTTSIPFTSVSPTFLDYDDTVIYRAPLLQVSDNADVTDTATACAAPTPTAALCGDDPLLPSPLLPPLPPTLPDDGMTAVTSYARRTVQIPPELSPLPASALTLTVTNIGATDYRGIRVRLYIDPDPDFGVADECAFDQEVYITYLEAGQTVTIDGPNQSVDVTCSTGGTADHSRSVRGLYGGPFTFPELRCGARYHLAIDVPTDQSGDGVTVDLSETRRVI